MYAIDNISIFPILEKENTIKQDSKISLDTVHVKTFHFDLGKAGTDVDLSSILEKLHSDDVEQILVIGHTDNTGDEELNQDLSYKRALYISSEIKQRTNIEISYTGESYYEPVSKNIQSKNRRVEVYFIKKLNQD